MKIRIRFAPSPTGYLHVGSLRTALYAFLLARHNKGEFLLRIEDTDRERFVEGSDENLMKILHDFGILWDNKDVVYQSKRLSIYKKYALKLVNAEKAYFCFCSNERIEELRKQQTAQKMQTGYDGLCCLIPKEEAHKRAEKESYVIRLKMPKTGICKFHDVIRGEIEFSYAGQEDVILMKSDGFPTYHLAHVVDDHEMKTSHVIRGEEWLPSVPKHLVLWEAFGWEKPKYAHLPLLVNTDKSKLSKRQGDMAVEDFLKKGYLKEALLNFILLLGWNPGTEKEVFSMDEMIKEFSLEKIHKSPAVFATDKLDWLNGYYIRQKPLDTFTEMCIPYLQKAGLIGKKFDVKYLERVVRVEQERIKKLAELPEMVDYFFKDISYDKNLLLWKTQTPDDVKNIFKGLLEKMSSIPEEKFNKADLEKILLSYIQENNLKNGFVLWPLRAALTGKKASPGPFEVAEILGKDKVLERIANAME